MKNKAVKQHGPPSWTLVRSTLEIFARNKQPIHGGLFYSGNVLSKYRYNKCDPWTDCASASMSNIEGEIVALKIMWHVAGELAVELNSLEKNPSRRSWQQCTERFLDELRERTQGIFGHYSMIIALDGVLVSRPALTKVCCWWPMLCTAYVSGLPAVYPGIGRTQEELFAAACHFHRKMREEFPKMSISECLAQLCWKKRGATSVSHL